MSSFAGEWAGRLYGTNTGNVFLELSSQSDGRLIGIARVNDDRYGVAVFEVIGTGKDGRLELECDPKQLQDGVGAARVHVWGNLQLDSTVLGKWESSLGTGGTFRLFPHNIGAQSAEPVRSEPEQIFNHSISIGAVRLFKEDFQQLVAVVKKDFLEGRPVVTYNLAGGDITEFADTFLAKTESIDEIRSLKIGIQEQEASGINRVVQVELGEHGGSTVRVSGTDESWVVGKAQSVARILERDQSALATTYKKHGLNLNQLLFLVMLAFLPEVPDWPRRLAFVAAVHVILVLLFSVHSKLIPNTVISFEREQGGLRSKFLPTLGSWMLAFTSSLLAAIVFWLLTRTGSG